VKARLDEDEAAARQAPGENWRAFAESDVAGASVYDEQWVLLYPQHYDHDKPLTSEPGATGPQYIEQSRDELAAHIARHDPARALREVAAGRAILAEHYILTCDDRNPDYEEFSVVPWGTKGDQSSGCVTCHYYGMGGVKGYGTCRTMRALAATWSDHPDYRQEWTAP
jgi:hypothetical protein